MTVLKKCPCGKIPTEIDHLFAGELFEYHAIPDCCRQWEIRFMVKGSDFDIDNVNRQATEAWNTARRVEE